jgi:integrase
MLDVHLIPAFGKRQLRELTREELQSFLRPEQNSWCTRRVGLHRRERGQKTDLPRRLHGPERAVLTPVQVRSLTASLNEPARSITLLLVLTGLRVGELLALRWGSIDLNARLLRVCEAVYDGHFDQPKTKRSARAIPIGTETAEILAALRPVAVDPKSLVFGTREGLPLERWNLLRKHEACREEIRASWRHVASSEA